jgi:predicted Rdx family selenoprotein
VSAAHDLVSKYQHVIDELTFVMGNKGVFDVVVDGQTLYSKHTEGRHAKPGEVLERFRAQIVPGVREYGT